MTKPGWRLPFPPPRAWTGASAVLVFAAIVLTFLALECLLRLAAHFENRGLLAALVSSPLPSAGSRVTLGRMIRRSAHPRIVYELRPGLNVIYAGGRVTTNDGGFRGRAYPPQKEDACFRIVGIGDSYMFGQGVSDEETYLARLEESLRAAYPRRCWQVINLAVPGYNTVMEVETLKAKGLSYQPDVVVLEVVGNDTDLPNFIRTPASVASLRRSFLVEFVARRLRRLQERPPEASPEDLDPAPEEGPPQARHFGDDPARVPPEYKDMVGLAAVDAALADLRNVTARAGPPVVVMTQGVAFDRRLWRVATRSGLHYLDVGPAIRGYLRDGGYGDYVESPLVIRQGDSHPSAIGHQLIAADLFRFLVDEGLLEASAARR